MYSYWKVTIKEVGNSTPLVTKYYGTLDRQGIIDFYGLNNPDVEWYRIEQCETK